MNYLLNITINQNKTGVSHIEKKSLTIATLFLYLIYTAIPSVTELVEVPEGIVIYKRTPKQKTEKGYIAHLGNEKLQRDLILTLMNKGIKVITSNQLI